MVVVLAVVVRLKIRTNLFLCWIGNVNAASVQVDRPDTFHMDRLSVGCLVKLILPSLLLQQLLERSRPPVALPNVRIATNRVQLISFLQ